jgi:hypothetical protein
MPSPVDPESAVRQYLLFLQDPEQVIDHDAVARLEAAAATAKDPIDKLKALSQLERARSADGETFKNNFIAHARRWSEANGVAPASFRQLGVGDAVLRAAGLIESRGTVRASVADRHRAKGVTAETIKDHILTRRDRFTMSQVADAIGGSPMTLRKAFEELVRTRKVTKLGPDASYRGRGRAPILYEIPTK